MKSPSGNQRTFLATRSLWWRAARIALPVGLLQASINQGDHWMRGDFSTAVVAKSLLTPLVTFLVAFTSAVLTARNTSNQNTKD
jgi:hypothetical protein